MEIPSSKMIEEKNNEIEKENQKFVFSVLFLVLIAILIAVLIFAIIFLVKNRDIIQSDPLIYGMKKHDFVLCQCWDSKERIWVSNEIGFVHKSYGDDWIDYSDYMFDEDLVEVVKDGPE